MNRPPILFYCQHLLGLGHLQRAVILARALVGAGERIVFVTGGLPMSGLGLEGVEAVALPPLTSADDAASSVALPDGSPPDEGYLADRRERLLASLARYDPSVVLLDLFPFGRHALAFELAPLLLAIAADRRRRGRAAPRVVVSLRDILVGKKNQAWYELAVVATVRQWVDRVLVHGSPELIPLSRTFGLADRLADRLVYTGYLAAPRAPSGAGTPRDEVVVSGGGGRVAAQLFLTALAARQLCAVAAARPWRLITGPYLPGGLRADLEAVAARLGGPPGRPGVVVETFRDDFPALLGAAALSISQAGYNTVLDVVASGVRAVVVPFEGSGDEQPLRARILAERGVLKVVGEAELSPARLGEAIEAALTAPGFPAASSFDMKGAARSVEILTGLVDGVAAARRRGGGGPRRAARAQPARRR